MEKVNSTLGLARTKSEQLMEAVASAMRPPTPPSASETPTPDIEEGGGGGRVGESSRRLSRKSSRRTMSAASPGRSFGGDHRRTTGASAHIRKARSAQMKMEVDEYSGAALSRASSASLGMSFSLTGYIVPPEDIVDSRPFSDEEEVPEDLEAGRERRKRIEAEPTLPIYLKFTEVTYKIILKGMTSSEERQILHGITGSVNPGEVLAMMGPSGSGKTTLLNLLGGRIAPSGGSITYNDQPYSKYLKSRIGFVTQDDVLFPHLTVRETLTYAAYLRLPKTLTRPEKETRADAVISELGLERCQHTMIGGSFVRGVSGGERKRVCIGNEIIINPSLLFLDEPTSGLDSTTALRTVQILQDIAESGKTVITTIHQPSSRLFHRFDKLVLLGRGSLLYFGKAGEAMTYFESIGCSPLIAMNPAEFLLDLANGNLNDASVPAELADQVNLMGSESGGGSGVVELTFGNGKPSPTAVHEYLAGTYESKVAQKEKRKQLHPASISEFDFPSKLTPPPKREWGAGWCEQYTILFLRGIKERRHDYFSWLRITQVLATAIVLGLLWWRSGVGVDSAERLMEDQAGLLFFIAVFWGFFPVFTAIFTFPQERAMLKKERAADMYRLSAYFVARTTSDLPLDLILPVMFMIVVYFMAGLRLDALTFLFTVLTVFLCIVAAQGLGLAIGASLMDLKRATTLASVTVMTFMLAGGYFVKRVPVFICWIRYLSFNYHTYKLLLKIQYGHLAPMVNDVQFDSGVREACALVAMVFGYRLLAYIFLRRMKLHA